MSSGAASVADGAAQVSSGAGQLAQSLDDAVEQIPTYSDDDIQTLSNVVPRAVLVDETEPNRGLETVPLFGVIALWLGGLALTFGRVIVPRRNRLTTVSSVALAGRAAVEDALLGILQGLAVTPILLLAIVPEPSEWIPLTLIAMFIGAVFAIVNHGLAAAFGPVGRVISIGVATIAFAAGIVSTVPSAVDTMASVLPTHPALDLLEAATVGDFSDPVPAVLAVVAFVAVGLVLLYVGVARSRRVSLRRVSVGAPISVAA
jgi:putative membrane protein